MIQRALLDPHTTDLVVIDPTPDGGTVGGGFDHEGLARICELVKPGLNVVLAGSQTEQFAARLNALGIPSIGFDGPMTEDDLVCYLRAFWSARLGGRTLEVSHQVGLIHVRSQKFVQGSTPAPRRSQTSHMSPEWYGPVMTSSQRH
ncbi:MAG: hypothetical protein R3F60_33850 [bacterium]